MGIFCISSRNVLFATADKEKHDIFLSKKVENGNFPLFSPKISGKLRVKSSGQKHAAGASGDTQAGTPLVQP